jgi:hypothetical protein
MLEHVESSDVALCEIDTAPFFSEVEESHPPPSNGTESCCYGKQNRIHNAIAFLLNQKVATMSPPATNFWRIAGMSYLQVRNIC